VVLGAGSRADWRVVLEARSRADWRVALEARSRADWRVVHILADWRVVVDNPATLEVVVHTLAVILEDSYCLLEEGRQAEGLRVGSW